MIDAADRLHSIEEYYFSKKLREVHLLKSSGKPIINLGIGSPDLMPPQKVIEALKTSLDDVNAHKYQSYQGLPELREAMSLFYREQFDVHLSPMTNVLPLIGSKEGIMHISMAFLNKNDEVLIPNPGYPTYASVAKLLGAKPLLYDLKSEDNWLPNIADLKKRDLSKVKIMWINYPHMPTGTNATDVFYEDLIEFAIEHKILLVNDNPYSFVLNEKPLSILSIQNSKDVCIELNSISKTFNMSGWRVGMVLGNSKFIDSILKVKSNMDSGMFYGIQKGAIEALKCSKLWYVSLNSVYEQRREIVWKIAKALNCTYNMSASGLFVWAKLPPHFKSEEFCDLLLRENHVFVAPGSIFGTQGEGYVRFSLCASTEELEEVLMRVS